MDEHKDVVAGQYSFAGGFHVTVKMVRGAPNIVQGLVATERTPLPLVRETDGRYTVRLPGGRPLTGELLPLKT